MKVAFYKGTRSGMAGVYNRLVRWWCKGKYSHVEAVFSDGMSASASFMDGGVRFKQIDYDPANWDFVVIPNKYEARIREWFTKHDKAKYDVLGNVHFVIPVISDDKEKWSCAESFAEAFGFLESWRFQPNNLASILRTFYEQKK